MLIDLQLHVLIKGWLWTKLYYWYLKLINCDPLIKMKVQYRQKSDHPFNLSTKQ